MYTYLILCLLNWNLLNIHYIPFIGTTIVLTSTHPAHHKNEEKKHVFRFFVCEFEGGVWIFWKYPTYLFSGRRKITYSIILPRGLKTFFQIPFVVLKTFPVKNTGWWRSTYDFVSVHVDDDDLIISSYLTFGCLSLSCWDGRHFIVDEDIYLSICTLSTVCLQEREDPLRGGPQKKCHQTTANISHNI